MSTDYSEQYTGKVDETFRCARCNWGLSESPTRGGAVLYYHCPSCVHRRRAVAEYLAAIRQDSEYPGISDCTEVFRSDVPGTRPRELDMILPDEERNRRCDAHWAYVERDFPVNDEGRFEDEAAVDRALEALTRTHQTGAPCPACLAYRNLEAHPELLAARDPEALTLEALQEQYDALLEAHETLKQEYEDIEVAYHATIRRHQQQED